MKKFKFYQDKKVSVWERCFISVEAESYEKALEKVECLKSEEITGFDIDSSEIMYETMEELEPSDNNFAPTIELYNDNHKMIGHNAMSDDSIKLNILEQKMSDARSLYIACVISRIKEKGGVVKVVDYSDEETPFSLDIIDDNGTGIDHFEIDKVKVNENDELYVHYSALNYCDSDDWSHISTFCSEDTYILSCIVWGD